MNFQERFGRRLRAMREYRRYNIKELAAMTGLPATGLSDIERGIRFTSPKKVELLAKALKVPPEFFFTDGKKIRIEANELTLEQALKVLNKFLRRYQQLENMPLDLVEIAANKPSWLREKLGMKTPEQEITVRLIDAIAEPSPEMAKPQPGATV